eukprot:GHVU01126952.1.p1 GENE.GHVU01126952.1~~GHVU01126952.1.p1  ORF type:complete len:612 (+),score=92.80 GHVU01126952.1:269-2104(+)
MGDPMMAADDKMKMVDSFQGREFKSPKHLANPHLQTIASSSKGDLMHPRKTKAAVQGLAEWFADSRVPLEWQLADGQTTQIELISHPKAPTAGQDHRVLPPDPLPEDATRYCEEACFKWLELKLGQWKPVVDSSEGADLPRVDETCTRPLVVVVPGFEATSSTVCSIRMAKASYEAGFDVLMYNHRGCRDNDTNQKHCRMYHLGYTDDLEYIMRHIHYIYPKRAKYLIGYSLGANMCFILLGKLFDRVEEMIGVKGYGALSCPIDVAEGNRMGHRSCKLYAKRYLKIMKAKLGRIKFEEEPSMNFDEIFKAQTLTQWDDAFTAMAFGYEGARDYYVRNSCKPFLRFVRVPTFVINSKDDPFFDNKINGNDEQAVKELLKTQKHDNSNTAVRNANAKAAEIHGSSATPSEDLAQGSPPNAGSSTPQQQQTSRSDPHQAHLELMSGIYGAVWRSPSKPTVGAELKENADDEERALPDSPDAAKHVEVAEGAFNDARDQSAPIRLVFTARGGHCGFHSSCEDGAMWAGNELSRFLSHVQKHVAPNPVDLSGAAFPPTTAPDVANDVAPDVAPDAAPATTTDQVETAASESEQPAVEGMTAEPATTESEQPAVEL